MGLFGSKISAMDIPWLVKQLNECQLPVDRNQALDLLEQVDQNLVDKKTLEAQARLFKDADGMRVVVRVGKKLVEDIFVVTVIVQIVDDVKMNVPLVMDFIEFGGVDLLEKAMRVHAKDDYLAGLMPKLIRVVLAVGASACIEDINEQGLNLLLCHRCQETIERTKNPFATKPVTIPLPKDRVNRVLRFMDNFSSRTDVQLVGLDAVIKYCRNADAINAARDTEVFYVLSKCVEANRADSSVLWRVAMAFALLAGLQSELAMAVVATNVHETLIEAYPTLAAHSLAQQQILWLFGSLLRWQRSKKMLHKSAAVMDFFKALVGDPLADRKRLEQEQRLRQLEADAKSIASGSRSLVTLGSSTAKTKPSAASTAAAAAAAAEAAENSLSRGDVSGLSRSRPAPSGDDDERSRAVDEAAGDADIEDDRGPELQGCAIEVAVPVQIRAFVRETQGRVYRDKKGAADGDARAGGKGGTGRARRLFDEQPRFGTVSTRLFTAGAEGLLPGANEDAAGNAVAPPPDWAQHLRYGAEPDKDAKRQRRAEQRRALDEKAAAGYD